MLAVTKFVGKIALVGTAVYVTVDNSIWDKSEYAKGAVSKVKTSLPETAELVKTLPSSNTIAGSWNKGVETVFEAVSNSPQYIAESGKKLAGYASEQNK